MSRRQHPPIVVLDFRPRRSSARRWSGWAAALALTVFLVMVASRLPDPESELAHAASNPRPSLPVATIQAPAALPREVAPPPELQQLAPPQPDFAVIGVVEEAGKTQVVIDRAGETTVLAAGQALGVAYRIDKVNDTQVVIRHLPTGFRHRYRLEGSP